MPRWAEIDTSRVACDGGGVGLAVVLFTLFGFGTLFSNPLQSLVLLASLVAAAGLLILVRRWIQRWFPARERRILLELGDLGQPHARSTR